MNIHSSLITAPEARTALQALESSPTCCENLCQALTWREEHKELPKVCEEGEVQNEHEEKIEEGCRRELEACKPIHTNTCHPHLQQIGRHGPKLPRTVNILQAGGSRKECAPIMK